MGVFKSYRELTKQSREIAKTTDFSAMRQNGLERMQQATEMMAAQTRAANIAATGVEATALVVSAQQMPGQINFDQMVELELTVMPAGRPPYPASVTQAIPSIHLARIQPGSTLAVKVDPADPMSIWIDFTRSR